MTRITLYTKAGCHLCETAHEILARVAEDFPLDIEPIDITTNDELYERYRYLIPVVVVEGGPMFELKISEYRLRQVLAGK